MLVRTTATGLAGLLALALCVCLCVGFGGASQLVAGTGDARLDGADASAVGPDPLEDVDAGAQGPRLLETSEGALDATVLAPGPRARPADQADVEHAGAPDPSAVENAARAEIDGALPDAAPHAGACRCVTAAPGPAERALDWLAAHATPEGGWSSAGFSRWCSGSARTDGATLDGTGSPTRDVHATALALYAFLGAGYTRRSEHRYGRIVATGLRALHARQADDGFVGDGPTLEAYEGHALATLTLVEAFGLTGSSVDKGPAIRALSRLSIMLRQLEPRALRPRTVAFAAMAWRTAHTIAVADDRAGKPASFVVPDEVFSRLRALADGWSRRDAEASDALRAWTSVLIDENEEGRDDRLRTLLANEPLAPPDPLGSESEADPLRWFFAGTATFRVGHEPWKAWETAMKPLLKDRQRADGGACDYDGSLDPLGPKRFERGRVESTACLALCAELWYRYDKVGAVFPR